MNPIRLIPDASLALAWLIDRADAHEALIARHLLETAHESENTAPPIWHTEVANGMLRAERGQRASAGQLLSFRQLLERLPILPDPAAPSSCVARSYLLARTHGLTVYDASYLELAQRTNGYLATFDRKLADAARASGVAVFGQPHGVAEPAASYG